MAGIVNSKEEVCNRALRLLGASAISSLSDPDDVSSICNDFFTDVTQSLLASYRWNFALKKQELVKISGKPVNEYQYRYALPSDIIDGGIVAAFNSTSSAWAAPFTEWTISGQELHTNSGVVVLLYIYDIGVEKWPAYFLSLATSALASKLAVPVTDSAARAQFFSREAFGSRESRRGGLFGVAVDIDAKSSPNETIADWPILQAWNTSGYWSA